MSKSIRLFIISIMLAFSMAMFPITSAYALTFPAEINQSFTPIAIVTGHTSTLRISIYNPNANQLTAASWTDDINGVQPGLSVISPLHETDTCGVGSAVNITTVGGHTVIALSGGTDPTSG